jgi:hypothetical protein
MLSGTRRYLLIIILLLAGIAFTWGQRWSAAARLPTELSTTAAEVTPGVDDATEAPLEHLYFVDVEGWYRITSYETVVRSSYDLTGETNEALSAALPSTLGDWQQSGEDLYIGDDPGVVYYLNHPTIALQRTYENPSGLRLNLAIIGNKGEDSFLLFSHTPETCYPGRLWQVVENRQESASLDGEPMYAQYLLTEHSETGAQLMVLYWYLWDDPQRDSQAGVLSIRVNLFIPAGQEPEEVLEQAWDFIRLIFPATMPWERF